MSDSSIERQLAENWMAAAVGYGDQAKALSEQLLTWQQHFLNFGNHKFDCAGNDGTVCECGYLQEWQKAFDAVKASGTEMKDEKS